MPVYSVPRSCNNLSSASPFVTGSFLFMDSIAPFDLGLAPSSSGLLYTDSGVVEDLSIRSTTHSVFPSQMDCCGPPGPSISYTAPVPSGPTVSISRDPLPNIQGFYQDFKLLNYPLDTFSGRLFDVASSTTFVTSDTQTELHHAITRLICVFFRDIYIYIWVLIFPLRICYLLSFNFGCNPLLFFVYRLFDIYEPGSCHLIDHEASLGNLSPPPDFFHSACEAIRGDIQRLRSNFL